MKGKFEIIYTGHEERARRVILEKRTCLYRGTGNNDR